MEIMPITVMTVAMVIVLIDKKIRNNRFKPVVMVFIS